MADVRINALATTATSAASDDYLALDGSANGTRKILATNVAQNVTAVAVTTNGSANAVTARYNSSNSLFGMTVNSAGQVVLAENADNSTGTDKFSKTGLPAFRLGNVGGSGTYPFNLDVSASGTAGNSITWTNAIKVDGSANTTLAGNLTVSGAASLFTGSNTTSLSDLDTTATLITKGSGTPRLYFGNENAANRPFIQSAVGGGSLFMVLQPYGGNVLVGALTDSGNGRIQLATHTTSAGGIGFGTDVSLYRKDANTLVVQPTGSSKSLLLYGDGTNSGVFNALSSYEAMYFDPAAHSVKLATNGFTALTLDSSQNATFAGTITSLALYSRRADNTGVIRLIPTSGVSAGSDIESYNNSGASWNRLNFRSTVAAFYTGASANTLALTVDDSQRTILGGALRLANAYVATPQTGTGYVTIQDSTGTTYKVLVAA